MYLSGKNGADRRGGGKTEEERGRWKRRGRDERGEEDGSEVARCKGSGDLERRVGAKSVGRRVPWKLNEEIYG